jgi:glycosyltransferase involved in cell wall biosynthesis
MVQSDHGDLAAFIRARVLAGTLPTSGKVCCACDLIIIRAKDVEYDVEMADGRAFLFHQPCLTLPGRGHISMSNRNVVLLLDSAPLTWTSQEDRHFRLSQVLVRRGVQPVLVFAEPLRPHIHARLQASGAAIRVINYGKGIPYYYRELRKVVKAFSITTAHIVFFDYFSALPWIARLSGIRHVIYEMQNSGELRARSWKKALLRLRTWLMTNPVTRVVAISEFVKQQLVNGGVAEPKIVVRYLGVSTERFRPYPEARREWAARFSVRPDALILSTVSYLRPFKNPQLLVRACRELAASPHVCSSRVTERCLAI